MNVCKYHKDFEEKHRPARTTPNVLTAGFDNGLQFKANADWDQLEEDIPSGSHRMHTPPPSPIRTANKFSRVENFDEWWAECWENGWALLDETESQREHHQKGSTGVEVAIAPQISCNRTNCNWPTTTATNCTCDQLQL